MKKTFLSLILALATMTATAQVDLLGSWRGKLDLGVAKLTLVFNLKQADGKVNVTMDSPDQSAKVKEERHEGISRPEPPLPAQHHGSAQ